MIDIKDECFKCGYWNTEKNSFYKCYTNTCPAKNKIPYQSKKTINLFNLEKK